MASLPERARKKELARLTELDAERLLTDWRFWARPKQLPPEGDWSTWVLRGGRGSGKTRSGAAFFHERAMQHPGRWMALVGRTPADVREYCIDGLGGLLKNTPADERPVHVAAKRRLTWPNGSWATIYSDEVPDQLRGFSGDTSWLDELGKFRHPQATWDNLQFGMREASSDRPRRVVTTTPRPLRILLEIEKLPGSVVTTMSSYENRLNLDPSWFETIAAYEGTRLGRQEIHAEYLTDLPDALWTLKVIEDCRLAGRALPDMERVVIGVDPSGTKGARQDQDRSGATGDEIGIIAAGRGVDGFGYVLADRSCRLGPAGWGRRVVSTYKEFNADRVVAEVNYGGAMVEHTIRTVDDTVSYREVSASRGKAVRAEPIAALYEQSKVRHAGAFPELEDQLLAMTTRGYEGGGSPDRLDAMVWALTELFESRRQPIVFV